MVDISIFAGLAKFCTQTKYLKNISLLVDYCINIWRERFCHQVDPSRKSHNAPDKYPTMRHFETEMCIFLLQNGAMWDMGEVQCGICVTGYYCQLSRFFDMENTMAAYGLATQGTRA